MKYLSVILILVFSCFVSTSCRIRLVESLSDSKKLEINEDQFIGKPLKYLLKEIRPEIKRVTISPGGVETSSYFTFFFIDNKTFYKYNAEGRSLIRLRVYVKKIIDYKDFDRRYRIDWWKWTKDKKEKYKDYIVGAVIVTGIDGEQQ